MLAATWLPYGPDGGDARSFAVDPSNHAHLYLGTTNGWIYETSDSGRQWKRLARVGKRDDLVLDTILVDAANPKHVLVGAWVLDHADGGIYQSADGGATWTVNAEMAGQSVRSLASAPTAANVVVAGTLTGVFRTRDSGQHWERISPPDNAEIHEVQSLAVDPLDPQTIYAGTWHLPWKTTDGGGSWATMKKGVIDDSDVFSIIIDPEDPRVVFASACSGIYKSVDKGQEFRKVQGIPNTARRTLVLMQDPQHRNIVFAGTTEGLWRSEDGGKTWARTTGPEVIVNDVFIDPADTQHMLLATDRGGVLASEDGGNNFAPANRGFSTRQITAFISDAQRPGTLYVGVVNDKQWGGVFQSLDGGLSWSQRSEGLGGRDVFSLAQSPDGTVLAGTTHGIFRLQDEGWTPAAGETPAATVPPVAAEVPHRARSRATKTANPAPTDRVPVAEARRKKPMVKTSHAAKDTTRRPAPRSTHLARNAVPGRRRTPIAVEPPVEPIEKAGQGFDSTVRGIALQGETMFAVTSRGLLSSDASGRVWHNVSTPAAEEWRYLAANRGLVVVGSPGLILLSEDAGQNWKEVALPPKLIQITALTVDARGEIWAGGREGVFLSSDKGVSWQALRNLYVRDVDSLYFDSASDRVLVTSNGSATIAFAVEIPTRKVTFWETGWTLRFMRPVGDHLLGVTLFDGVVIQPQMVEAKSAGGL